MAGLLQNYQKGIGGLYGILDKINRAASPGMTPAADPQLEELAGPDAAAAARAQAERAYRAQRAAAIQKGARAWEMDALAAPAADDSYQSNLMRSAQAVDMLRKRRTDTDRQSALQKLIGSLPPEDAQLAAANPEAYSEAAIKKKLDPNKRFQALTPGAGSVWIQDSDTGEGHWEHDPNATLGKGKITKVDLGDAVLVMRDDQVIASYPKGAKPASKIGELSGPQFNAMMRLSAQYQKETKDIGDQARYYNQVLSLASDGTGMNDYAIVYAFNHMIEPESVVKEGERDFMLKVAPLRARMNAWIQNKKEGDVLDPMTRKEVVDTTARLKVIAQKALMKKDAHFKKQAKMGAIPDDLIIQDYFGGDPDSGEDASTDDDGWSIKVN